MGDMDKEIRELYDKTAYNRHQFLKTELETCLTGLEMGTFALSVGNAAVAGREVVMVEEGIRAIQRFLPGVSGEQAREVETKLAELKARLDTLKAELNSR